MLSENKFCTYVFRVEETDCLFPQITKLILWVTTLIVSKTNLILIYRKDLKKKTKITSKVALTIGWAQNLILIIIEQIYNKRTFVTKNKI